MSPTKKRQTMGKVQRERELRERRAQKQEKKDAKKEAAARIAAGIDSPVAEESEDGETAAAEPSEA